MMRVLNRALLLLPALTLAAWLAPAAPARADAIDAALFKNGQALREELLKRNYKNVGVLKFELQRGDAPPTLQMGRLNGAMANRLENVLIYSNDDLHPIGVTRAAGDVAAAADPEANYRTPAGRLKLLKGEYPLAWGAQKVAVDAFLTGRVRLAPDLSKADVTIVAFDKDHVAQPEVIATLSGIRVTRSLLSEMNLPFLVKTRGVVSTKQDEEETPESLDATAVKERLRLEETSAKAPLQEVLDFKVYYDGQPVAPLADDRLPPPAKGQKVHFELTAKEKLGLVLRVNGINTADGDQRERAPDKYSKWILEPNQKYEIQGIYSDGKVATFTAVDLLEAQQAGGLGVANKVGKIELDLFRAGTPRVSNYPSLAEPLRSAQTPTEAKEMIAKLVEREPKGRHVIIGKERKTAELEEARFESQHAGAYAIIYFVPEAKKIGPPAVQK